MLPVSWALHPVAFALQFVAKEHHLIPLLLLLFACVWEVTKEFTQSSVSEGILIAQQRNPSQCVESRLGKVLPMFSLR